VGRTEDRPYDGCVDPGQRRLNDVVLSDPSKIREEAHNEHEQRAKGSDRGDQQEVYRPGLRPDVELGMCPPVSKRALYHRVRGTDDESDDDRIDSVESGFDRWQRLIREIQPGEEDDEDERREHEEEPGDNRARIAGANPFHEDAELRRRRSREHIADRQPLHEDRPVGPSSRVLADQIVLHHSDVDKWPAESDDTDEEKMASDLGEFRNMTGRKNAMLTTEDRRWLTGEKVYDGQHAKQQRYQRRRDIRECVYNSMLDFSILPDELDDEWRDIFSEVVDGASSGRMRTRISKVVFVTAPRSSSGRSVSRH
jgi:hypothetical protein